MEHLVFSTYYICNSKGYGAIRSKIGLFTFFNFSIVILVDLDALIPNICVFFVLGNYFMNYSKFLRVY